MIELVHRPEVDPNFLNLSARTPEELKSKAASSPGQMLTGRKEALIKYISEAKALAESGGSYEKKLVPFLEEKKEANEVLWAVYNGEAGADKEKAFIETSVKVWAEELPKTFEKLEGLMAGPYTLGDQIVSWAMLWKRVSVSGADSQSLGDLHVVSWLTRLISVAGGEAQINGLDALDREIGGSKIGPKLRAFWEAWVERESFKKVLVPSCDAFLWAAGQK